MLQLGSFPTRVLSVFLLAYMSDVYERFEPEYPRFLDRERFFPFTQFDKGGSFPWRDIEFACELDTLYRR